MGDGFKAQDSRLVKMGANSYLLLFVVIHWEKLRTDTPLQPLPLPIPIPLPSTPPSLHFTLSQIN